MKSRRFSLPRSMMFTRRTDTVTTSAPDASTARRVSSKSLYFPVPTQRRDLNSIPAMISLSSGIFELHSIRNFQRLCREHRAECIGCGSLLFALCTMLFRSSRHKAHDLNAVALFHRGHVVLVLLYDVQIKLHSHALRLDLQKLEQAGDRKPPGCFLFFSIHSDKHPATPFERKKPRRSVA